MGGLQKLLLRITPIVMLICFICFGITYTFQRNPAPDEPPITYLSSEVITIDDRGTIDTTDDITLENFTFDFTSYRENLNINILQRATDNIIDFSTYQQNLNRFNLIWEDGYNFGDGVQTITNAILLVINTLIVGINVILTPLRLTAGIILTALSVLGINITRNTVIITALNGILDHASIPLISTTRNKNIITSGTIFTMNNSVNTVYEQGWSQTAPVGYYYINYNFFVDFSSQGGGRYTQIFTGQETINNVEHYYIWYVDRDGYQIKVYDNGWLYQDSKIITITANTNENESNLRQINKYFNENAS